MVVAFINFNELFEKLKYLCTMLLCNAKFFKRQENVKNGNGLDINSLSKTSIILKSDNRLKRMRVSFFEKKLLWLKLK